MLMHATVNNAKDIVPSATPGASDLFGSSASLVAWLTVTILWICDGTFLARMPKSDSRAGELPADPEPAPRRMPSTARP